MKSLRIPIVALICFGSVFGLIAGSLGSDALLRFDLIIIHLVQGLETNWLTGVMKFFSRIGSTLPVVFITIAVTLLMTFVYRRRYEGFLVFSTVLLTVGFNILLKSIFKRERPEFHRILQAKGFSFPSGHAMMAFSLYTILAFIIWRHLKTKQSKILLLLFTALMIGLIGISRIYVGVHFPSDIIGGMAASGFLLTILCTIFEKIKDD